MRSVRLILLFAVLSLCNPALAYDWSTNPGDGSPENPYQISTTEHLMSIGADPILLAKHYILTNDIIFDPNNNPAHIFTEALIAPGVFWAAGSFQGVPFTGTFDGNCHSVENLRFLNVQTCGGLFGCVDGSSAAGPSVKDLTLKFVTMQIDPNAYDYVGALAGATVDAIIENCSAESVDINGPGSIGGLIGSAYSGIVVDCSASGSVRAAWQATIGGLIGYNRSVVKQCFFEGIVDGTHAWETGGLVGVNNGSILSSHSSASVTGNFYIGGLVGDCYNYREIIDCYATGPVNGMDGRAGGLLGRSVSAIVKRCYATGSVTAGGMAGGLIGYQPYRSTVEQCYATGTVGGTGIKSALIGQGSSCSYCYATGYPTRLISSYSVIFPPDITSSYFLGTAPNNKFGIPLTEQQMKQQASFTGWDFLNESANGQNEIWRMCQDGIDYPHLSWEFAQNGDFACADGIDLNDLLALADHWLMTEADNPTIFSFASDANADAQTNLVDLAALSSLWP